MSQKNGSSNSQPKQLDTCSAIENEMEDWFDLINNSDTSFKEDLENGDQTLLAEKLNKRLDKDLTTCPIDDLDRNIFSAYLADASQKFTQLTAEINKKLLDKRKNENDIKTKIKICEDLLECWQKCMKHLQNLQNISVTKIKSFPNLLFNVVKSAFILCNMSDMKYGDTTNNFSEEIAAVFRKSNEVMNAFLTISDSVINFDVEKESELCILSSIINEIGDTAVMVNRLDLKTVTGIWKQFGKLATLHGEKIKLKFPERVIQHFDSLRENILSLIFSAVKGNQQKINEKQILCGKMLLKILNKLWNIYYVSVSDETAHSAVKLLVSMYRYSSSCLIATEVDPSIIKFIEINISDDLESFFNTAFNSEHCFKAFFEFGKGEDIDAIGYHLLTLNVMRKLLKLPYDIKRNRVIGEPSILDVAFTNIDLLQLEICLGKLQISVSRNNGEIPKSITIYEETFIMIWGLICQVPPSDFGIIENLLVKHLMSGKYWSSLLTVDVWCIISRCASTQLCYDHLKYFMKVYDRLSERENSLEVFILSFLIRRIYQTISENKKDSFVENLEISDPNFWYPLSGVLTCKGKSILQNRTSEFGNDILKNFQFLNQKPSVKSWTCFTSLLKISEIHTQKQDKETMKTLSNIWNSIDQVVEFCEGIYLILLSELMVALFHCNFPCKESFNDGTISSILKSVISLLPYTLPYVRIKLLNWLKNIFLHSTDKMLHLSTPISEIYVRLLQDETPWVRQEAFEYFNNFTRNSPNEDLVGSVLNIVIDKATLSESLPAYISSTAYYKLSGFTNTETFFRQLLGSPRRTLYQHTCYEVNEREDKFPKLEDSASKIDCNVNQKIENICNELDNLLDCRSEISQESFERLRQTFVKICDQRVNSI